MALNENEIKKITMLSKSTPSDKNNQVFGKSSPPSPPTKRGKYYCIILANVLFQAITERNLLTKLEKSRLKCNLYSRAHLHKNISLHQHTKFRKSLKIT